MFALRLEAAKFWRAFERRRKNGTRNSAKEVKENQMMEEKNKENI